MGSVWAKLGLVVLGLGVMPGLPLPWTALYAQTTTVQCQDWREGMVREWIERSRTHIQYGRTEAATKALLRALESMGRSPSSTQTMEILRMVAEEQPTGILESFVALTAKEQEKAQGLAVLSALLPLAQSLPTAYSAVKTQSLTAIAHHYLTFGEATQGREILAQATAAAAFLQGEEFQTKALTAIAQVYATLGDNAQAETLLDQSLSFARRMNHPQPFRHGWVLEPIALTYAGIGRFEQALAVADLIRNHDPSLQSYGNPAIAAVVQGYGAAQQWETALDLLAKIDNAELRAVLLAEFAGQHHTSGDPTTAQTLLQRAIATAREESSEGLRTNALMRVIRTYGETTGNIELALPLLENLADPGSRATLFSDFAVLAADSQRSIELINQGLDLAREIEDDYQRSGLMNRLIDQHIAAKRWAIALPILQGLPEEDTLVDKYSQLDRLARAAAGDGDFSTALAAADSLPETWEDYRNQIFQRVAVGYATEGNFAAALDLFRRITNNGSYPYQVRTLTAIADQARLQGDLPQARALLAQAQQITATLDFIPQQADALTALAIALKPMGQPDQAQQFRTQALDLIQRDPGMLGYYLQEMITQYLAAEDYQTALQVAITVPDIQDQQAWILNDLATKLIEADAIDAALQATATMTVPEDKARFLLDLSGHYLTQGDMTAVERLLAQATATAKTIPGNESRQLVFRAPPDQTIVDDPFDRGSTLEAIALRYGSIGQTQQAMAVAQLLQTPTSRDPLIQQLNCYQEISP